MVRDLWGTCTLPIPAPHRHISWYSQGPLLCLLTGRWVPGDSAQSVDDRASRSFSGSVAAGAVPTGNSASGSPHWRVLRPEPRGPQDPSQGLSIYDGEIEPSVFVGRLLRPEYPPVTPAMKRRQRSTRPLDATDESDLTMARRVAAGVRNVIWVDSLEDYWKQWRMPDIEDNPENAPPRLVDEFGRLVRGEACLAVPDGTRWLLSSALFTDDRLGAGPPYNRFVLRLVALMVEHKMLRGHMHTGLNQVALRQDTLNYRQVFCTDCGEWCDLEADAEASRDLTA
jgi:hypothetical protein